MLPCCVVHISGNFLYNYISCLLEVLNRNRKAISLLCCGSILFGCTSEFYLPTGALQSTASSARSLCLLALVSLTSAVFRACRYTFTSCRYSCFPDFWLRAIFTQITLCTTKIPLPQTSISQWSSTTRN